MDSLTNYDPKFIMKKYWQTWSDFWFLPMDLQNVGLFRLLFGLTLLGLYLLRFSQFDFYFSESGLVTSQQAMTLFGEEYRPLLTYFLPSDQGIFLQGILHLILIFLFAVGALGRCLTPLLFLVNLGLLQRNYSIVYGADLFANFWLFYFCFIQHNKYYSVLNLFNKNRLAQIQADMFSTLGIRFIQIQMCLCYAYTGFEKLKGTQWWDGTAIWHVVGMEQLVPNDFGFLRNFPILVGLIAMTTILYEVYFTFAVWSPLRRAWLLTGLFLHLGIAVFLNLWFFGIIMLSAYCLFMTQTELKPVHNYLSSVSMRFPLFYRRR